MNVCSLRFENRCKITGFKNANDVAAHDILGTTHIHDSQCSVVDILHFELFVKHKNAERNVVYYAVGKILAFLFGRKTHGDFRLALIDAMAFSRHVL